MVNKNYTPERGDIVWIDFNLTKGHEQSGLRPAVIISPFKYNLTTGLAIVCPVTTKSKGYPFEILVSGFLKKSFVLADQIRTIDIKERIKRQSGKILQSEMDEILARMSVLIQ